MVIFYYILEVHKPTHVCHTFSSAVQRADLQGLGLFSEGKCFCTCGVILELLSLNRGLGSKLPGVTHEKKTWFLG